MVGVTKLAYNSQQTPTGLHTIDTDKFVKNDRLLEKVTTRKNLRYFGMLRQNVTLSHTR